MDLVVLAALSLDVVANRVVGGAGVGARLCSKPLLQRLDVPQDALELVARCTLGLGQEALDAPMKCLDLARADRRDHGTAFGKILADALERALDRLAPPVGVGKLGQLVEVMLDDELDAGSFVESRHA